MSSNINNFSTLHSGCKCEDLCIIQLRNQQTCTSELKHGRSSFYICFVIGLLMQHEFRWVKLIGRSCRTSKWNHITPTYLSVLFSLLNGFTTLVKSCISQLFGWIQHPCVSVEMKWFTPKLYLKLNYKNCRCQMLILWVSRVLALCANYKNGGVYVGHWIPPISFD